MTTATHSNPCCSSHYLVLFFIAACATWLTLWTRDRHITSYRHRQPTDITWEFAGPTTYVSAFGDDDDDDSDNPPKLASAAAVQNVVRAANNTWFIGSVNGGIWRTRNIRSDKVHWESVLDHQPTIRCTSMSAMHVSQSNPTTLYAGCGGSTSGEQGPDWNVVNSGDWGGIMVSYDLGDTWAMMDGFPVNYYVTGILEVNDKNLLVSTQSHLWDRSDGGIWLSSDGGGTFDKVEATSTFTLTPVQLPCDNSSDLASNSAILATHAHSAGRTASISTDGGKTFNDLSLPWREGAIPFYTCATQLAGGQIIVGGLTRLAAGLPNNTASQIFLLPTFGTEKITLDDLEWLELDQPMRMDQDSMPKDRMALLADPKHDDMLYVAGNAEALAWRVNTTTGEWSKLWDEDVVDGSIPHGDCRNYAWDSGDCTDNDARLVLVSDGGVFARLQPRNRGGRWISLNGDYAGLELLSAKYDAEADRYVMGAQDNCAIVTKPGAIPGDVGLGFVEGDGTVTMVDSQATPSRLFGTTQFLGVGTIDDDPKNDGIESSDDDDDDCGGFCFVQGDEYIQIKVNEYFTKSSNFPYFVHPYTLNRNDPTRLHIWVNGTMENADSTSGECGFYEFQLPYSVKDADDIAPPTTLLDSPPGEMILDFVSGGITKAKADPDLIVGISTSHLYVRSGVVDTDESTEKVEMEEAKSRKSSTKYGTSMAELTKRPLPITFAAPVGLQYDYSNDGARILGPLTHARTVFMEVSSSDSQVIAITGWTDIDTNLGEESIFVTMDGGQNWRNVTGNLRDASGVCGKVRPGGLLLMDLPSDVSNESSNEGQALLVGTSNGILATFLDKGDGNYGRSTTTTWRRLGGEEFPIVLVTDITYDSLSDRLVAATYGRGIYIMKKAQNKLQQFFLQR